MSRHLFVGVLIIYFQIWNYKYTTDVTENGLREIGLKVFTKTRDN